MTGALAYMPPEVLSQKPACDTSLDIFSFGHLSLYVTNQKFPFVYDVHAYDEDNRVALQEALKNQEVELLIRDDSTSHLPEGSHPPIN